ncbi:uncharacterized protein DSM5745_04104 [Aspergillus mulundensis]|uniref:Uncharacterized protein n=1 Tax=Aspergillus mulundensis TaxID=1810919 RepID=A0A3D8SDD5_9EURO|nr:Uncharacterized protein DSM5745_04104 [Aspergillus mulundensis]RDW83778.1 Uncharacterized protein DSM5745_04104 [Aspergillus mulundensis]
MHFAEPAQTPPQSQPSGQWMDQHLLDLEGWDQEYQDLMVINWLCVDFRQRLLDMLQTSCQNNFNEARNLAKERLSDLVERLASSDDLHGALCTPSLDSRSSATAPQLLPRTPHLTQYALPTGAQKDTHEDGLMCTPEHATYNYRGSQVVASPPGTGPALLSPIALNHHELPPGCSDFLNFDLLSDGQVFSIGTHAGDAFDICDSIPVDPDLNEMELDPPDATATTTNITTDNTTNSSRISSPNTHSTPHFTTPNPASGTPSPPPPLAGLSTQETPGTPASPPAAPQRRQVQTRTAAQAAYRSTPSPSSAPTQVEAENEVAEPAPLSPSTSWTHSIPTHLPSPDTVLATFTHHLGPSKQSIALLLTRLFYAVGSPDALSQLRHAVKLSREQTPVIIPASPNDLATTVKALDHLDSMTTLSHILRRYYLVRLLEHRTRLEQDHVTAQRACRRPKRMLKYDCARVELIKSGRSGSATKPNEKKQQLPKYRSKSQALADLMQMLYPDLKPAADGKDCVYSRKLTKLRNRLSCARNWYRFEQAFPGAILALIPCAGRFSVSIDQIEKLPSETVQVFLRYLQEHRGPFMRCVSETLGTEIFSVLGRTSAGSDTTPTFAFEKVEEDGFGDVLYDTDEFVSLSKASTLNTIDTAI